MIDGLYGVSFEANGGGIGSGTVVVSNGSVNGGDYGYCYQGQLVPNDGGITTTIAVEKFNPQAESVFGPMQAFDLELAGSADDRSFAITGHVVQQPQLQITIRGRYIKPLL